MRIANFSSGQRVICPSWQGRSRHVAAAVGMAIAVLLIAPVVLTGAPSAHADTGVNGYARCVGGDTKPPPPGVSAEDWFPSVHVIANDLDSGVPSAQVAQRLVQMGVDPKDAVTRVQCFLANQPRGEGH
jgi:membrane-associated phospholipid phosphatase